MLVGGAAVRPYICPQPTAGASQTGVYLISPIPRGRTHCGVVWPLSGLLAHCQACGAASMGSGQGCISRGGSPRYKGVGGAGLACFVVGGPLWEGPCSMGREAGRPVGGMDPQKHRVGYLPGASKFGDRNWLPLGFWLGDGRGRWLFPAPLFPVELSSVFWSSTPLPPSVLSPSCSLSRAADFQHSRC